MQKRHSNRKQYFEEQAQVTEKYVIPYIEEVKSINKTTSILEIGCGEGGNLVPFLKRECKNIVGVDISKERIENAKQFFGSLNHSSHLEFICEDIYNVNSKTIGGPFDIIITRDVLEHIHNQEKFMNFVKDFLASDGKFFQAFPPLYNPFGGHQQMCNSKLLSRLPFIHLLPNFLYKSVLKLFGESKEKIEGLLEIKQTGITIDRFEHILRVTNYNKDKRTLYFINPNYEIKFGLTPKKAWKSIENLPFIRNFFITAAYYIVSVNNKNKP